MRRKVNTIKFNDFMSGEFNNYEPKCSWCGRHYKECKCGKLRSRNKAYSFIFINPWSFVDPTVCTLAGIVLLIALLEKFMERKEYFAGMQIIQSIMDVALPISGIAALIFFLMEVVA